MSHFAVFGGSGSDLGTVKLLHPKTWADFVKETLGHAVLLNLTREQFHQLDKTKRAATKRVAYVTPATFNTSPCRRVYENTKSFNLIAIDLDVEPDGSCPAAVFTRDPNMLHLQLAGLQFAAYTTSSSTPEQPRLRIFVAADNLPVADYPRAVHTIGSMLGLATVTKESLIVVQPMYLPTIFRDDDLQTYHPLIAVALGGEALQQSDLGDTTTPTTPLQGHRTTTFHVEGDDLDFLRPTVEGLTLEDVENALGHLDPDMMYPEWLEVAAALRHQFPTEPEAPEAYGMFDTWSAKGEKYAGAEDTLAKWNSLRATPKGRAPVTIRSVLHKAQEAGWSSSNAGTNCYNRTVAWMTAAERTGHELMEEGVKRILATPLMSPLERSAMLSTLQDAMKRKGLKTLRTELKKELQKLERKTSKLTAPTSVPEAQIPSWSRGMCYVAGTNEFFHRATNRILKPEAYDYCYNVFLTEDDSPNGKPAIQARDYSLNIAKIPRVDNYRYDPAHADQAFLVEGKQRFINTYLPTYPEPAPADMEYAGDVFLAHLCTLIAEPEYQQILVDWMAYQVQNPGAKIRWAVLIQGAEGCGKTALAEALRAVLGTSNVAVLDASLLLRDMFNGWAMGSQVVAIEEIRVVGHNRHEVMNRLKPCISNDHLNIRVPFKPAFQVPNNVNYMMFTNHHDSLAVGEGDRRYFVVNSALQNKAQVRDVGTEHFVQYYSMLKEKAGGLRAWFTEWKISDKFNPNGHAPVTRYLGELMKAAATPLTAAVVDAIADGDHPLVKEDLLSSRCLKAVVEQHALPRFTDQNLASVLRELDFVQLGRFRIDDDRHYLWSKRGNAMTAAGHDLSAIAKKRLATGNTTPKLQSGLLEPLG